MEKEIKDFLIKNRLYGSYNRINVSKSNNPEEFFRSFKLQNFKTQQKMFACKTPRDKNGFFILDQIPFLYSNKTVKITNDWLLFNNGAKVLLKTGLSHEEKEQELVIMYLLRSVNMACATYDIATYRDKEYLVTPSFLKPNEIIINPYTNERNIKKTYEEAKDFHNEVFYLKTILLDRLYGNDDRFYSNYGIITNVNAKKRSLPRNCPLFDNGEGIFKRESKEFPDLNRKREIDIIFSYLLENEDIMYWVTNILKKVNLEELVRKINEDKGIIINDETFSNFQNFFKDSEYALNQELKAKGIAPCIKLT